MSISLYSLAFQPQDDFTTSGGAIDLQTRPLFAQLGGTSTLTVSSDGTDTRIVAISARDVSNNPISLVADLSVSPVTTIAVARFLWAQVSVIDPLRTITIKAGATPIATIPPNELAIRLLFIGAFSETAEIDRFEKIFARNDGTSTITNPFVALTSDPELAYSVGLDPSVNSALSTTNRKTAPVGVTFSGLLTLIQVPSSLTPSSSIGIWVRQRLSAQRAGFASPFTVQVQGGT